MTFNNKTIWIIGASSGIGRALAVALADLGAQLILSARREEALQTLQQELGDGHLVYPLDVAKSNDVKEVCEKIAQQTGHLDCVLYLPALYQPASIANMELAFASKMVDVNIKGAFYVTHGILPIFEKQQAGQIVLCGSVAGYTGLPNGQPYSATKAALANFAESLYAETPDYIDVKLISPGFVHTPLTEKNTFEMPLITTPQQAARTIIEGLGKEAYEIHFPKKLTFILKLLSLLPYRLKFFLTKKMKK